MVASRLAEQSRHQRIEQRPLRRHFDHQRDSLADPHLLVPALKRGVTIIGAHCGTHIVPGDRDYFAVTELPVLGTGKLDLRRVRDLALEVVK